MALSPVAGPFPIASADPALTFVAGNYSGVWVDGAGFVCASSTGSTHNGFIHVMNPSGKVSEIGSRATVWKGAGWSHDDRLCLAGSSSWIPARLWTLAPLGSSRPFAGYDSFATMPDRVIWFHGYAVMAHPIAGGSSYLEATISSPITGTGMIFPYKVSATESKWWLANLGAGRLWLYDAIAKAEVPGYQSSFPSSSQAIGYSRKHGLFILRRGTDLYWYSREPIAASVSPPAFSPAPSAGRTSKLSARVLGSRGEPCAGRVVTFAVSAGTVDRASVETDKDGWAATVYRAPFVAANNATATATLTE